MIRRSRIVRASFVSLIAVAVSLAAAAGTRVRAVNDSIWVANRLASVSAIREFDATTGAELRTVPMAPNSQPGDLAYAKGKLYVAEEFCNPPAVAVIDAETGGLITRIPFPNQPPFTAATGWRPHHVHASESGTLVAVGLYGTDLVALIDTRDDSLLGPWDSNIDTITGRVHAAVFSKDGNTLYLANEGANELVAIDPRTGYVFWRMTVPGVHELVMTHDGKRAYASRRGANKVALVDLERQSYEDVLTLGLPDTMQLSANEKVLTIGLRTSPAQLAVVNTETLAFELVNLGGPGTTAGHQWTSPSGRVTFASFEGGAAPGVAVIDHRDGNNVTGTLPYAGRPHGVTRALP
jgi:DNA-binding beta-propeller fold protein YncE